MKTNLKILGCLLILFLATFAARATVVLSDTFSYTDGLITNVSNNKWSIHSGNNDFSVVSGTAQIYGGVNSAVDTGDVNASLTNGPYAATNSVSKGIAAIYASFTINVSTLPGGSSSPTYFAHFKDGSTGFRCRIYIATNNAASGNYRVGVANYTGTPVYIAQDCGPSTNVTVVMRYVLATGISSLWLNPANETSAGVTDSSGTVSLGNISAFAMRQNTGEGLLYLDNLVVGTTFADVVSGSSGSNPPFIALQPADAGSLQEGNNVSFTNLAGGDLPLSYQWYQNTNTLLANATNIILALTNITTSQSGTYDCVVTNTSGSVTSRYASLTVTTQPIPPVITNQPQNQTVTYGDTATFTVLAGGSSPLHYQWEFVPSVGITNPVGGNSATLTLANADPSQAGSYFVVITNQFGTTNSASATLTVTPPGLTNISYLRTLVDPVTYAPTNTTKLFKVRGVVTTWANMSTAPNSDFYIQDATAGIVVFWNGAPGATYLPPAGTLVEVVAPLNNFYGLLELNPYFTNSLQSVTVISNNVPLPAPQALPFDPAIQNNIATMEMLEGSYFVASNVFVNFDAGSTFVSGSNEPLTNGFNTSQSFILYVNPYTDIVGQPKPHGPVTIYGVLGQYKNTSPYTGGYEFTPSRYADIVLPVVWTNVLSNLTRLGDQITNTFAESVVRPGEQLTMDVTATDPASGSITTFGPFSGKPSSASSTTSVSGGVGRGHFVYQAPPEDTGKIFTLSVPVAASTWSATYSWSIYVPSNIEQQVYISEFLANPTTNTGSPAFNPLQRSNGDTNNVAANDQYVEVANLSDTDVDLYNWTIGDAATMRHTFYNGSSSGETLYSSNCIVVYSGPPNNDPCPPNTGLAPVVEPANPGPLAFKSTGGVITLHNKDGHLVDRVVYSAGDLSPSVSSMSRFPTLNGAPAPQAYISTNYATPGLQYDGSAWGQEPKMPTAVSNIVVTVGNPLRLQFTANTSQATTLWQANDVSDTFRVVAGLQFPGTAGVFYVTNPPPVQQFYFITTQ